MVAAVKTRFWSLYASNVVSAMHLPGKWLLSCLLTFLLFETKSLWAVASLVFFLLFSFIVVWLTVLFFLNKEFFLPSLVRMWKPAMTSESTKSLSFKWTALFWVWCSQKDENGFFDRHKAILTLCLYCLVVAILSVVAVKGWGITEARCCHTRKKNVEKKIW